jgi:hypothetical protein
VVISAYFFPAFIELSPIELNWAAAKRFCRNNIKSLRETVPLALKSVTASDTRAFWRHTDAFVQAYHETKCSGVEATQYVKDLKKSKPKVYRSHRRIKASADLDALQLGVELMKT